MRVLKWIAITIGSLLALVLIAVIAINAVSFVRQRKTYPIASELLVLRAAPDPVRGQHLTEECSAAADAMAPTSAARCSARTS